MVPRVRGGRHDVEGDYLLGAALDEHFHETNADEAGSAGDDADGRNRGVFALSGDLALEMAAGGCYWGRVVGHDVVVVLAVCVFLDQFENNMTKIV